jgi:transposase
MTFDRALTITQLELALYGVRCMLFPATNIMWQEKHMEYPPAILEKAQRLEQLLLRVAAGESLDAVNAELGFKLAAEGLARQQAKYEAGGRSWQAVLDGRQGHARKAHSALREWLYARKREDDDLRSPQLVQEIRDKFGVELSGGHVNYLLRKCELTAPPGHPYPHPVAESSAASATAAAGEAVENAGFFFSKPPRKRCE